MERFFLLTTIYIVMIGLPLQVSKGQDRNQALKKASDAIERIMDIHYIQPKMRSPYDFIQFKDGNAFISIWKDLPPEPDPLKVECQGYQWLLTGRGKKLGLGAAIIFKKIRNLKSITLQLVEVDFDIESVDGRGKLKKVSKGKPYLSLTTSRTKLNQFKPHQKILKEKLGKNIKTCVNIGRKMVSERKIKL